MTVKTYCVVSDGVNIYLPVKAKYYPNAAGRSADLAYLREIPNFFGGRVEQGDRRSYAAALCREVRQESQEIIELQNISTTRDNTLKTADITVEEDGISYRTKYFFWLIEAGAGSRIGFGPTELKKELNDDFEVYEPAYREMESVIKVPIARLTAIAADITQATGVNAIAESFLKECGKSYGDENFFVNILNQSALSGNAFVKKLSKNWDDSETKAAFVELVKRYAPQSP